MLHDTFVEFNVYWIFKTVEYKKKKNIFDLLLSYYLSPSSTLQFASSCFTEMYLLPSCGLNLHTFQNKLQCPRGDICAVTQGPEVSVSWRK